MYYYTGITTGARVLGTESSNCNRLHFLCGTVAKQLDSVGQLGCVVFCVTEPASYFDLLCWDLLHSFIMSLRLLPAFAADNDEDDDGNFTKWMSSYWGHGTDTDRSRERKHSFRRPSKQHADRRASLPTMVTWTICISSVHFLLVHCFLFKLKKKKREKILISDLSDYSC